MQEFGQAKGQLTAEAMSDAEAQEVLRLHMRRSEGAAQISVGEVADAIRLPEDEVRKLLSEIREQKRTEALLKGSVAFQKRKTRDAWIASIAAVLFLLIAGAFFYRNRVMAVRREEFSTQFAPGPPIVSAVPSAPSAFIASGPGLVGTFMEAKFFVPCEVDPQNMSKNADLLKVLVREMSDRTEARSGIPSSDVTTEGAKLLQDVNSGHWDVKGIDHPELTLQVNGRDISVTESMLTANGNYKPLQDALENERENRLKDMLDLIATKARLEDSDTTPPAAN